MLARDLCFLDLSGNQLTTLPAEIAQLVKLVRLNLSDNQIEMLPPAITRLTALTDLNLSGTRTGPAVVPPVLLLGRSSLTAIALFVSNTRPPPPPPLSQATV